MDAFGPLMGLKGSRYWKQNALYTDSTAPTQAPAYAELPGAASHGVAESLYADLPVTESDMNGYLELGANEAGAAYSTVPVGPAAEADYAAMPSGPLENPYALEQPPSARDGMLNDAYGLPPAGSSSARNGVTNEAYGTAPASGPASSSSPRDGVNNDAYGVAPLQSGPTARNGASNEAYVLTSPDMLFSVKKPADEVTYDATPGLKALKTGTQSSSKKRRNVVIAIAVLLALAAVVIGLVLSGIFGGSSGGGPGSMSAGSGGGSAVVACNASSLVTFAAALNCTHITGDLFISSLTDLPANLTLPHLRAVSGSIIVHDNPSLSSLSLPLLSSVGGSVTIEENAQLAHVTMPSLSTIAGNLSVGNNELLQIGLDFASNTIVVNGAIKPLSGVASVEASQLQSAFNMTCNPAAIATVPPQVIAIAGVSVIPISTPPSICQVVVNTGCAGHFSVSRSGQCEGEINCPEEGDTVVRTCKCMQGSRGVVLPTTRPPFYWKNCTIVPCPAGADSLPCDCTVGYQGTLSWNTTTLDYSGSCQAVPCPADSTGFPCACNPGYAGTLGWNSVAKTYTGSCTPAVCPGNASGLPCACNTGFEGVVSWDLVTQSYTGSCSPAPCPSQSSGLPCACNPGLAGPLVWDATQQVYTGVCQTPCNGSAFGDFSNGLNECGVVAHGETCTPTCNPGYMPQSATCQYFPWASGFYWQGTPGCIQTLASFGFDESDGVSAITSRGGLLGPVTLSGNLTRSTNAMYGNGSADLATPIFLQLPQTALSYAIATDGLTIEGFLFLPSPSVVPPSSYWTWFGLFDGACAYISITQYANVIPPMLMESVSMSGNGNGFVQWNTWNHVFVAFTRDDQVFVGFNGAYSPYGSYATLTRKLSRFPTLDRVGISDAGRGASIGTPSCSGLRGVAPGVQFDELRITAGVRYVSPISMFTSYSYTVPTAPLLDDAFACRAAAAPAITNATILCTGAVLSGKQCPYTCAAGLQPRGTVTCRNGVWLSDAMCAVTLCNTQPAFVYDGSVLHCVGTPDGSPCTPRCVPGYQANSSYTCSGGVWTGTPACLLAPIPPNAVSLPPNSYCGPGYQGVLAWSTITQSYHGVCTGVPCPAHSDGASVPDGCRCSNGYVGSIAAAPVEPTKYYGKCVPGTRIFDETQWYSEVAGPWTRVADSAASPLFMVVTDGTRSWRTRNGQTWYGGEWEMVRDVVNADYMLEYGNGLFLAVSSRYRTTIVATSTTGLNWTKQPDDSRFSSERMLLSFANGFFFLTYWDKPGYFFSTDGTTWTAGTVVASFPLPTSAAGFTGFVYGKGRYLSVSQWNPQHFLTGSDPGNMTYVRSSGPMVQGMYPGGPAFGNGRFVINNPQYVQISYSTTGFLNTSWAVAETPYKMSFLFFAYDRFFLFAQEDPGVVSYSADGIIWYPQRLPEAVVSVTFPRRVVFCDVIGRFFIFRSDGNDVASLYPYWLF